MPDRETFFITGFPGFIANRLLERLARKECDFILLVQPSLLGRAREEIARIAQLVGRDAAEFKFVEGDITEPRLALSAADLDLVQRETTRVFHLAAVVDSHALAHGGDAPVAFTHVGLSVVLYPITGLAIAGLALSYGRAFGGWRRVVAGVGIVAGLAQATSVPLTLVLPDAELSPVFAAAAILTAVWAIGTGAGGVRPGRTARAGTDTRREVSAPAREQVPA